jgi:glycosyltransferase involved in cell wall biosynthesis
VNVLFLSLDFLIPAERGLRVRSLSQLRVLSSVASVERITFLALCETEVSADQLRALEREVPKVRGEPPVLQPKHMRRSPKHLPRLIRLRMQGVPYLIAKSDNVAMRALVERHLKTGSYDVVYIGHLGMAAYLSSVRRLAPKARVVLEQHNVEWEIFRRLGQAAPDATSNSGGRDGPSFALRQAARWEAWALRRCERRTLRAVDAVIAISDADAQAFKGLAGIEATVVPTYIEAGAQRVEGTSDPSMAYTGLLAWQPNAYGLDWFCKEVWPHIRLRIPEATLTIAGPGLRRKADGSLSVPPTWSLPGIRTVGYVDDLEDVYRNSLVTIAPIIGGSGVRMKLLESMRAGMPTVTTTDGAAGLDVEDGREMFIADDGPRFADRAIRLLSDGELRARMRRAGYAYLEKHHSLAVARQRLVPTL